MACGVSENVCHVELFAKGGSLLAIIHVDYVSQIQVSDTRNSIHQLDDVQPPDQWSFSNLQDEMGVHTYIFINVSSMILRRY